MPVAPLPLRFLYSFWVGRQRPKKNKLDLEKTQQLEALPQWSWNPLEDQWKEGFEFLKKYAEEYGHARVTRGFKYENFNLGSWVGTQRRGKDKLDLERVQQLEELPRWSWDPFEDQWNEGLEYLKKYVEEQGHAKVPLKFKYEDFNLGSWVGTQRRGKDKLNLGKIQQLEELPRWSWDLFEDQWNEGFEYLKRYVEEQDHTKVPYGFKYEDFNLGAWVSIQRLKKDKLGLVKIQKLESLPQWTWHVKSELR